MRGIGALAAQNDDVKKALENSEKICPKCGAESILRTSAKWNNSGSRFWGCSRYPRCKQIMDT